MPIHLMPDMTAGTIAYARAQPDLVNLVGQRTDIVLADQLPCVMLALVTGGREMEERIAYATFDIHGYHAGGDSPANEVARTADAALLDMVGHTDGTVGLHVAGVATILEPWRNPDETGDRPDPLPRYTSSVEVHYRPDP